MPKTGMAPVRRRAFVEAAIRSIHDRGFVDLTTGDVARARPGCPRGSFTITSAPRAPSSSPPMRHLLIEFGAGVSERLREAKTPAEASVPRSWTAASATSSCSPR